MGNFILRSRAKLKLKKYYMYKIKNVGGFISLSEIRLRLISLETATGLNRAIGKKNINFCSYLKFFIAVAQCCHLVIPVPSNQFAQWADQLIITDTVHVHLLLLVLQALETSEVGVGHRLNEPVACKWLLVGVGCSEALLAVRHLACHTCLNGILRRVLLTELALDWFWRCAWAGHGGADGDQRQSIATFLTGRVGPTVGGRQRQR